MDFITGDCFVFIPEHFSVTPSIFLYSLMPCLYAAGIGRQYVHGVNFLAGDEIVFSPEHLSFPPSLSFFTLMVSFFDRPIKQKMLQDH